MFDRVCAQGPPPGRILFKVARSSPSIRALGDLAQGDVLIDGQRIAAVGANLSADGARSSMPRT